MEFRDRKYMIGHIVAFSFMTLGGIGVFIMGFVAFGVESPVLFVFNVLIWLCCGAGIGSFFLFNYIRLMCMSVVIDEKGIERKCCGKRIQFIAWEDMRTLVVLGHSSRYSSGTRLMSEDGDIFVSTERLSVFLPKCIQYPGVFIDPDLIYIHYREDVYNEICKYRTPDIPGQKPRKLKDWL